MSRTIRKKVSTAYDVARLAGVSQSTVSRAFTPGASISAAARALVTSAAKELGYRPNFLARSLITRRSNIVGLAMAHIDNEFYSMLLASLNDSLARTGRRLLLFSGDPNGDSDPMLSEILMYQVDALILASTTLSSRLAENCRDEGIPVVVLNRSSPADNVSTITGDNKTGATAIANMLLQGGHRRLAAITGIENSSTNRERIGAFCAAIASAGLDTPRCEAGLYRTEPAREATRTLLSGKSPPDGIFCCNDLMAFAAIEVARHEFGLEVGNDISIIGFDDVVSASSPQWSLTTYSQPVDRMAALAAALIEGSAEPGTKEIVPGQLVVRKSARIPFKT